jgi:hypothetical protein
MKKRLFHNQRHAELVSASIMRPSSVPADKWTLKRVQGDVSFYRNVVLAFLLAAPPQAALAQEMDHSQMGHSQPAPAPKEEAMDPNMPGMDHSQMDDRNEEHEVPFAWLYPRRLRSNSEGSGTSRLPGNEGGMHGLHIMPSGDWMLMLHGFANGVYTKQSGPRGDDKAYVQSMLMLSAQHDTDWGKIQFRSMNSLEPIMSARGYPSLFASGETAGGAPLVDRQHPHDFFMELSARVCGCIG